jgi:RNA polymerase sigma-70 factor (ECF subfamily)
VNEDTEERTDSELIEAANRGERAAFEALYYRYRNWVYSLAYRFCDNEQDACDVLQETFFYFFNKFPNFELRCRLKTFLYPATKHLALNRRKKASRTVSLDDEIEQVPAPESRDHDAERRELAEMIEILPEPQREVVFLRFADGLDLREISEALQIPLGTVKSRLHQAMSRLRKCLPLKH